MWRKGNPHALFLQMGAATVESSMKLHQTLKMELTYDPVIPFLGIYLKKPETLIQKKNAPLSS